MFGDPMTNTKAWVEFGYIGNYTQIVLGTTPNSKNSSYWNGEIKWITPAEMTEESYYIYDTERHLTEEGLKAANLTLLPCRSVLFSTRAPIGKVGLVGSPMYCNQGFKNFVCGDQLNPVYLYYSLIFKREYLVSLGTGTTFKELSKKAVENLKIAVPPLILQNKFEEIYQQADKSKFGDFKSQFIEMCHKTHKEQTLESVCTIMGKGITPKYVDSSSVVVINQACVHWDGQHLEKVKYHNESIPVKKRTLETGDVLLNATGNGTLGRCCVFNCPSDGNIYINDGHVIVLLTDRAVILPEVLNTYLSLNDTQAEIYRQYVTGSTNQVDIVFTDIKKMKVPVPNMGEQILFVEILKQADKSKSVIQKALVYLNDILSDKLREIA